MVCWQKNHWKVLKKSSLLHLSGLKVKWKHKVTLDYASLEDRVLTRYVTSSAQVMAWLRKVYQLMAMILHTISFKTQN